MAQAYEKGLAGLDLILPCVPEWAVPAWHLFVVRSPRRDALQQSLGAEGVGTLIHYPIPPISQEAYRDGGWMLGAFPLAERCANEVLSLPIGPHLNEKHLSAVVAALSH